MYNETIYNVFISPQIQDRIFKKRDIFFNWLVISLALSISLIITLFLDFIGTLKNMPWINAIYFIVVVIIVAYGAYVYTYDPVKNYHITLKIYYYLLFLNYFYFDSIDYPHGYKAKLKYLIVVQGCIDSIDKFITTMEEFLISGENTSLKIIYMREFRNLFYKVKRRNFFDNNMDDLKIILNDYFSSIHEGLISVFKLGENIEYFDNINLENRVKSCKELLMKSSNNKKGINELYNIKSGDRRYRITLIIIIFITSILIATNVILPTDTWTKVINIVGVFGNVITIVLGVFPKNIR